jgi:phosphoribosyl 1,2-cyclic phosphate phosphodiesterase
MKLTVLGSGGCVPIPKPLCQCPICQEAREKGRSYSRTGSCAFLHDLGLLIDTPPLVNDAINNANLTQVDHLLYTHLDGDHLDGHGVLCSFYFDGTRYLDSPSKTITFLVPPKIDERLGFISS